MNGFEYESEDVEVDELTEEDESTEPEEEFVEADGEYEGEEDTGEMEEDVAEVIEAAGDLEGEAADIEESDPEVDETDESVTVGASARVAAAAARNRQAKWARRIAADQRLEARRAATAQRSITNQLRTIRAGGRTRVYSVGSLQGAGVVTAVLPNGRRSRMRIIPTLAPISEVNRLRAAITINDKRQAVATGNNSRAIAALTTTQASAVKKLTEQQVKSDKDLAKRLVEGDNRLDKRITKELTGTGVLDKHGKRMMRVLRRQRTRSLMNGVLAATAAPFFVAYGDRTSPFTKNNGILTGSLLFWMVGDDLLDMFAGKSGFARGGATAWSYLAPFLNAGTVYLFLGDKQHVRFVSGVTTVPSGSFTVPLTNRIAKGSFEGFKTGKHMVVATLVSPGQAGSPPTPAQVSASVNNGELTLTVNPALPNVNVAWIVDTRALAESA